jgi:uncharacterized membrane-anchored protein YitT (DUF2179 family)
MNQKLGVGNLKILTDYILLLFAGILYSFALKYFVLPSKVILTGTEGIASSLSYYYESYWVFILLYLVFQSLLMIFGFIFVSRVFVVRSFIVVATVVVSLSILPEMQFAQPEPHNERIILVIFGGLIAGVAKALAFQRRGSTGDEDIPGAYFSMKYLKPVGSIAVIAAVCSTGFGLIIDFLKNQDFESVINTLMYTCIYIFVSAETLNNLYRKFKITMLVIITQNCDAVCKAINSSISHRTYTLQQGTGGHTGSSFCMVRTVVTREELPVAVNAVELSDKNCFFYYHDLDGISKRYYISPIG